MAVIKTFRCDRCGQDQRGGAQLFDVKLKVESCVAIQVEPAMFMSLGDLCPRCKQDVVDFAKAPVTQTKVGA